MLKQHLNVVKLSLLQANSEGFQIDVNIHNAFIILESNLWLILAQFNKKADWFEQIVVFILWIASGGIEVLEEPFQDSFHFFRASQCRYQRTLLGFVIYSKVYDI